MSMMPRFSESEREGASERAREREKEKRERQRERERRERERGDWKRQEKKYVWGTVSYRFSMLKASNSHSEALS